MKGIVLELFRIKDRKGFSLGLVSIAVIILLSSIVAIGGRDEVLLRSDLSIPERSFYTFMPYFLPFGVLMTLLTVYDFAFPRVLKITLDGVRSRFWKLSWSEITDIRVIGQAGRSKSQGQPMVVLDVIPQAHSREKWKNMRDSLRVWALYIPIIPAPKYEIRLQTTLRVGGEDLAAYLRDCRVRATQGLPLIPPMG